jgi:Mn2+/Fe2+ NRAMP family transporter
VAITVSGSFRSWERSMFLFVFANLLVIPLFFMAHPNFGQIAHHLFIPGIRGGASSTAVLLLIAIVGTTVAPWQLFFQQSNIVDKRISPRWINYERVDTFLGAFVVVLAAGALICVTAFAFEGTHWFGNFTNAGGVSVALEHTIGSTAAVFFAIVLLNASLIGAGAVTLATSYVMGDIFGGRGSLHRRFSEAKGFYSAFAALILLAAGVVLIPGAPLGVILEAVQALCGILLPMTTLFLLMLSNDREVLGPWANPPWLKALASVIVAALILLSMILTITTLFPHVDVTRLAEIGGIVVLVALIGMASYALRTRSAGGAVTPIPASNVPKERWTMPPASLLTRVQWSTPRRLAMLGLGSYMVIALVLLVVKSVQLAGG